MCVSTPSILRVWWAQIADAMKPDAAYLQDQLLKAVVLEGVMC